MTDIAIAACFVSMFGCGIYVGVTWAIRSMTTKNGVLNKLNEDEIHKFKMEISAIETLADDYILHCLAVAKARVIDYPHTVKDYISQKLRRYHMN